MRNKPLPLWDLPTRVFHWMVVACLCLAWASAELGMSDVHEWTGYTVLTLVVSRVLWGFIGSEHSRFGKFLVGPAGVLSYLQGRRKAGPGHNPLGGWSVMAMLLLLLIQAVSGLFNSDDVLFSGPLYYVAGSEFRGVMGTVHELAFNLLLGLVLLHLMAVAYHQRVKGEKLLKAMIHGSSEGREGTSSPVSSWRALAIVTMIGLALWWGLQQAPQPEPIAW